MLRPYVFNVLPRFWQMPAPRLYNWGMNTNIHTQTIIRRCAHG